MPNRSTSYTVAWIAALYHERAAATGMLDERHQEPQDFTQNQHDTNSYTWGRVGKHFVVIASLPSGTYGVTSAAITAQGLRSSLPHIRIGLLVGIGAGVPGERRNASGQVVTKRDIRLGDVVVSNPDGVNGGVVQYDLVKAKESFERKGFLDSPRPVLRNAVAALQAEHQMEVSKISFHAAELLKKHPKMCADYIRPPKDADRLFTAMYAHENGDGDGGSCQNCSKEWEIERIPRDTPEVHYGTIASGNTVVKDAVYRDKVLSWLKKQDVEPLCFEMEAAGLMNNFPCLVIRGICDYGDSHKHDQWQKYAAVTAAAFAKELLEYVRAEEVNRAPGIDRVLNDIHAVRNEIHDVRSDLSRLMHDVTDKEFLGLLHWISPETYSMQYDVKIKKLLSGTCGGFIHDPAFQRWTKVPTSRTLLCYGDPGTGKTMIATRVIQHLFKNTHSRTHAVLYLYCDYTRQEDQTTLHLLESLLQQIVFAKGAASSKVLNLRGRHRSGENRRLTKDEIQSALLAIAVNFEIVFIVIDALDECKAIVRAEILSSIQKLMARSNVKVLATSRPHIPPNINVFPNEAQLRIRASDLDMEKYIRSREEEMPELARDCHGVLDEAVEAILGAVNGIFLLARLHVDSLVTQVNIADMKSALRTLPEGSDAYDDTYRLAMARVGDQPKNHRNLAEAVLKWVIYARRPLRVRELQDALAVEHGKTSLNTEKVPLVSVIVSVCGGLVTLVHNGPNREYDVSTELVQMVHYTAYEYLMRVHSVNEGWTEGASLTLAQTCINYLSFDAFASGPCNSEEEFTRRSQQHAMLGYAAEHWGNHARDTEKAATSGELNILHNTICGYFQKKISLNSAFEAMQPDYLRLTGFNRQCPAQITGWHLAAFFGLRIFFEANLRSSSQIDEQDSCGRSPLSYSASEGHVELVQWLLESNRVNANSKDNDGTTPLSHAVQRRQYGAISLLIDSPGIEPNLKDVDGVTPLSLAAFIGDRGSAELILKRCSVDINAKDNACRTPLMEAVRFENEHVAELLPTSVKIDVNSKDELHRTALMHAARNGCVRIVNLFLKLDKVTTHLRDFEGRTLLSQAAEFGQQEIIQLVLTQGKIDVSLKDDNGQTLLSRTAELGLDRIVRLLLLTGKAETDSVDMSGWTPLMFASSNGHEGVAKLLLHLGKASAKFTDVIGWTPLAIAANHGRREIVELLLAEMRKDKTTFSTEVRRSHDLVLESRAHMATAQIQFRQRKSFLIRKKCPPPLDLTRANILAELEPWLLAEEEHKAGETH